MTSCVDSDGGGAGGVGSSNNNDGNEYSCTANPDNAVTIEGVYGPPQDTTPDGTLSDTLNPSVKWLGSFPESQVHVEIKDIAGASLCETTVDDEVRTAALTGCNLAWNTNYQVHLKVRILENDFDACNSPFGFRTTQTVTTWRSSLYPTNWTPGYQDAQGRFLQDFSYAGYHRSERAIPTTPPGSTFDVTRPPYNADSTGAQDSTPAIQRAIDAAASQGGGIVYLPAGTYRVKPQGNNRYALLIHSSRIVLRGAGFNRTFIYNDETNMREKEMIRVAPSPTLTDNWRWPVDGSPTWHFAQNARTLDTTIRLQNVSGLNVGEYVVLKTESTPEWIAEHQMTGKWTPEGLGGLVYYRKILAIDTSTKTITIDAPVRYPMLMRDQARVYRSRPHIEEVGVEDLSLGMKQVRSSDLDDEDYNRPGTVSYAIHQSHALLFNFVVNGWAKNVHSYRPSGNTENVHILSNGLKFFMSRSMTAIGCDLRHVNYKGEGGNGYLYIHQGNENLIVNSYAENGRHNYDFSGLESQGNVILRSRAVTPRLPTDFHMYLSAANLIDNMTLDADYIGAVYRDVAFPKHGHVTTQSVFWNTKGLRSHSWKHPYLIETGQWGWGYAIGTSGNSYRVKKVSGNGSEPLDFVEGENQGETLRPVSLFEDQLNKRRLISK